MYPGTILQKMATTENESQGRLNSTQIISLLNSAERVKNVLSCVFKKVWCNSHFVEFTAFYVSSKSVFFVRPPKPCRLNAEQPTEQKNMTSVDLIYNTSSVYREVNILRIASGFDFENIFGEVAIVK